MKNLKKSMVIFLCIFLITGCSNRKNTDEKGVSNTNSVNQVINNQTVNNDNTTVNDDNTTEASIDAEAPINVESSKTTEDMISKEEDVRNPGTTVDYDLTQMSSSMVYATVYQMMMTPQEYEGKTFRIDGNFYATYYEPTKKYYFYCIIQDATACCTQGMEFVWDDGYHIYPDEYPDDNAEIIVEGTFETYREEGDQNLYGRLSDATLQQKN